MFIWDVYQLLGNVSLELLREIRDRDIDWGIIMREETGEIRGDWTKGTEPKGISWKSGKERGSCKQNWEVIRVIEGKHSSVTEDKEEILMKVRETALRVVIWKSFSHMCFHILLCISNIKIGFLSLVTMTRGNSKSLFVLLEYYSFSQCVYY